MEIKLLLTSLQGHKGYHNVRIFTTFYLSRFFDSDLFWENIQINYAIRNHLPPIFVIF